MKDKNSATQNSAFRERRSQHSRKALFCSALVRRKVVSAKDEANIRGKHYSAPLEFKICILFFKNSVGEQVPFVDFVKAVGSGVN